MRWAWTAETHSLCLSHSLFLPLREPLQSHLLFTARWDTLLHRHREAISPFSLKSVLVLDLLFSPLTFISLLFRFLRLQPSPRFLALAKFYFTIPAMIYKHGDMIKLRGNSPSLTAHFSIVEDILLPWCLLNLAWCLVPTRFVPLCQPPPPPPQRML